MRFVRLAAIGWWLQLKMRSRSAFDGFLSIVYPMFFATTVFFIYRQQADTQTLVAAAVGASVLGMWSAVATTASMALQGERRQGTLELLVAAPAPFAVLLVPITLSMATIGLYSLVATLLWGRFAFGIPVSLADPLAFSVACLVTALSVSTLGFVLAVSAVRYRSAWALGTAFELPVWLICGFLIPIGQLPDWVRPVSWLVPTTWGVGAIKGAAAGGAIWGDVALCVLVSIGYAVVGTLLAHRLLESARARATLALS